MSQQRPRIDTKTGRDRLPQRREPYWQKLSKGCAVGFRKASDGGGHWVARYRREDLTQAYAALGPLSPSLGFDEAKVAAEKWFADQARGVTGKTDDGEPHTVEWACREYVKDRERQKGKAAGNEAHRRFEREVYGGGGKKGDRHAAHSIAKTMLAKIRTRHIEAWRDGLVASGLSKASANRTLTTLKAALNFAVKHRYVSADLAVEWGSVSPFKGAHKRRDLYLDLAQRRALRDAATGPLRDLIEAAMLTGARAGELTSALRSQFDERTQSLTLVGKTGARTIPVSPPAVALFERLAEGKAPDAFLLTRGDGKPWAHSDWDELVRAAVSDAKLPTGTVLYTLRHSWITQAITDGMSPLEVARLVGTSLAMIDKNYGHLAQTTARERLASITMV